MRATLGFEQDIMREGMVSILCISTIKEILPSREVTL